MFYIAIGFLLQGERIMEKLSVENDVELVDDCPVCKGRKTIKKSKEVIRHFYCKTCSATGTIPIKCDICEEGKYKTKMGYIVDCKICRGSGIQMYVTCPTCRGFCQHTSKNKEDFFIQCWKCKGSGSIKVNPFNAVIK